MKRKLAAAVAIGAAIVITGCGAPSIADVDPDTPRAEKDEIYTAYIQDTYGEEYPTVNDTAPEMPQTVLRICSALDDGTNASTLDTDLGFDEYPAAEKAALLDIVYQGTRVYCPEHTGSVEWMNPGGAR